MTDPQAELVWKYLPQRQDVLLWDTLVVPSRHRAWGTLLQDIRQYGNPHLMGVPDGELSTLVALWLVGPPGAPLPPVVLRTALLSLVQQSQGTPAQHGVRAVECAIAYGCGERQDLFASETSPLWRVPWASAMQLLARIAASAVVEIQRWLVQHVVGFPQAGLDIAAVAWVLAERLRAPQNALQIKQGADLRCTYDATGQGRVSVGGQSLRPLLSGARYVFTMLEATRCELPAKKVIELAAGTTVIVTARDTDLRLTIRSPGRSEHYVSVDHARIPGPVRVAIWECTCGTQRCAERHRLTAWDPYGSVSLWSFVASAVKGPRNNIATGSLVEGMYYALLAQEDW